MNETLRKKNHMRKQGILSTVLFFLFVMIVAFMSPGSALKGSEKTPALHSYAPHPKPVKGYFARATGLFDYTVIDMNGEELGQVSEMLVDISGSRITYVVFSVRSGVGQKLFPIPVTSLVLNREEKKYMVSLDKDAVLGDAPSLRGREFPDTILQGRRDEEKRYLFWYNLMPIKDMPPGFTPVLAETRPIFTSLGARIIPGTRATFSALQRMQVMGKDSRLLGSIDDLLIDPKTTRIHYVLFSPENIEGRGEKLVAIPLSFFTLDYQGKRITCNAGPETLRYAPAEAPSAWKNFTTMNRRNDVRTYWAKVNNPRPLNAGMRVLPAETARATDIMGYKVKNVDGMELGHVADFVIDENGNVPYAVVDFGSVLGIGGEWYFVPLKALTVDTHRYEVLLGIDRETLEEMPGYEIGAIPHDGKPGWDEEIRAYWHAWTSASFPEERFRYSPSGNILGATAMLISEIMDYDVRNPERKQIGEIEDMMLDLQEARVAYEVLSFGGFLGAGEKLFAIPFEATILDLHQEEVIFDVRKGVLEIAPGFDKSNWPKTANPLWHEDVDTYWWNTVIG